MTSTAPRRGRPARVDKDAIVEAVWAIGTAEVTMRGVAEHLGISLPGLYHHVKNQDELLRIATHAALVKSPPPSYVGEHWATFLRGYAGYVRSVLAAEPALVEKFVGGAVRADGEMEYIAGALDALGDHGLTPDQAMTVWAAVSALAIGSVAEAHREHVNTQSGQPWLARIFGLTAREDVLRFPTLRAIGESGHDPFGEAAFDERMTLLLSGIAAEYDLPPEPALRSVSSRTTTKRTKTGSPARAATDSR
jgi:AcrR family transcriptional regulator